MLDLFRNQVKYFDVAHHFEWQTSATWCLDGFVVPPGLSRRLGAQRRVPSTVAPLPLVARWGGLRAARRQHCRASGKRRTRQHHFTARDALRLGTHRRGSLCSSVCAWSNRVPNSKPAASTAARSEPTSTAS